MNPVFILLIVAFYVPHWVAPQPVAYQPFGIWSRSVRVLLDVQPLRTRSLPSPTQSIGNYAGLILRKSGDNFNGLMANKVRNNDTKLTTVTTTTEWPISAQPATVDIETLPGFWLKDPSRIPESTGTSYQVDYRTERYRLDDLLLTRKTRHDDKGTHSN